MAYMSQENKKLIAPQVKAILKKYNMKGSLSVRHHSSLVLTLKEGELDIIGNLVAKGRVEWATEDKRPDHIDVNTYWLDDAYTGDVLSFLIELSNAMNGEGSGGEQNFDKSDLQSDYHHVGWYITISVGTWSKPFIVTEKAEAKSPALKAPAKGTKIAHALVIYKSMLESDMEDHHTRQSIISALSNSMQITRVQAAGYYQNAKKKVEA